MDVEYPYAQGQARLQLLYRLPSAPPPRRLLLVTDLIEGDGIGAGWGGPVTRVASSALDTAATDGGARFDAVAVPAVLGGGTAELSSRHAVLPWLQRLHELLVPGGLIVGHVDNLYALRRWATPSGLLAALRPAAMGSAADCRATLLDAGFTLPECFYVQPSIVSPMGLIPCERVASRAHFLRSIRAAQGHYGHSAYAARLLMAWLGLGGMQQAQLFFWARKAC
jgi:hypothetical protein